MMPAKAVSTSAITTTFAYAHDAVGDRTAQTSTITSTTATTYTYDAANRMTQAGGVAYTWDNNGNLTNDGSAIYTYDSANRLVSATVGMTTTQFAYNGDPTPLRYGDFVARACSKSLTTYRRPTRSIWLRRWCGCSPSKMPTARRRICMASRASASNSLTVGPII